MNINPKQQVTLIIFSSILSAFSLASIINFTDPLIASFLTFAFLYLSLFILSLGIITLIGLGVRQWLRPGHYVLNLSESFRQGFLISILITTSLLLLSKGLLFWWVQGSLILFLATVEAFFNLKA